MKSMLLYSK